MMWPSETLNDALALLGYPALVGTDEARRLGGYADDAVRTGPLSCSPRVAMAACYYLLQVRLWANKENLKDVARAFDCSQPPVSTAVKAMRPYFDAKFRRGWKP